MALVWALMLLVLSGTWHGAAAGTLSDAWRDVAGTSGGPVCRRDTVIDEMQRQIRAVGHEVRIVRRLVQQTPTPAINIVRCDVCALDAIYDTPRLGDMPARRCVGVVFEVRTVKRGFIVRQITQP